MARLEFKIVELIAPRTIQTRNETLDTGTLGASELAAKTICSVLSPGTEVAAYRGDPPLRPMKVYPRVLGYCNVAEVLACGERVSKFRPGDWVLTGQSHRSAFICSEEKVLAKVPQSIDPAAAATTYLFHLGHNALLKGEIKSAENLAIIGLGTLGLATAALANFLGATVYGFSDQAINEGVRHAFGLCMVLKKSDANTMSILGEITAGGGIDVVVSTSNRWMDWRLALSLPRMEGRICVLGFPGRTEGPPDFNPLSSEYFYDRQLKIIACGFMPIET